MNAATDDEGWETVGEDLDYAGNEVDDGAEADRRAATKDITDVCRAERSKEGSDVETGDSDRWESLGVSLWAEVGCGEETERTEDPWVYTCVAGTNVFQGNFHSKYCLEKAWLNCVGSHDALTVAKHSVAEGGKSG